MRRRILNLSSFTLGVILRQSLYDNHGARTSGLRPGIYP